MSSRDIKHDLELSLNSVEAFTGNTSATGEIVDVTNYDTGIVFAASAAWTDGTYTPVFRHSPDSAMAGAVVIPDEMVIGAVADLILTADYVADAIMPSVGFFGTDRYIQVTWTATGVTTGATVNTVLGKRPNLVKAAT